MIHSKNSQQAKIVISLWSSSTDKRMTSRHHQQIYAFLLLIVITCETSTSYVSHYGQVIPPSMGRSIILILMSQICTLFVVRCLYYSCLLLFDRKLHYKPKTMRPLPQATTKFLFFFTDVKMLIHRSSLY